MYTLLSVFVWPSQAAVTKITVWVACKQQKRVADILEPEKSKVKAPAQLPSIEGSLADSLASVFYVLTRGKELGISRQPLS